MPLGVDYKLVDLAARPEPAPEPAEEGEPAVPELPAGVYNSIRQAINDGGGTIVLKPGVYEESVLLEKGERIVSLRSARELLGDAGDDLPLSSEEQGPAEVRAYCFHAVSMMGDAELLDVTVQQRGPGRWFAVLCAEGAPKLTKCEVACATSSCIGVCGGAEPIIAGCTVHGSEFGNGIAVFDQGKGTVSECEIFGNAHSGVDVDGDGSELTLERCNISRNRGDGILIRSQGKVTATENKVYNNFHGGIELRDNAKVEARENEISGNNFGVIISKGSTAALEGNKICRNYVTGVEVSRSPAVTDECPVTLLQDNLIECNLESGVKVWYQGAAKLDSNKVQANLQEMQISPRSRRGVTYEMPEEVPDGASRPKFGTNVICDAEELLEQRREVERASRIAKAEEAARAANASEVEGGPEEAAAAEPAPADGA